MPGYGPTLAISLLALALALTALWLVADMVKRMVVEAKALVDASTRALWRQHTATERTVKAAIENQRMMADEIARLRHLMDERERRERDLAGRIAAVGGELERQTTRILALVATVAPRPAAAPARSVAPAGPPRPAAPPPPDGEGGLARWLAEPDDTPTQGIAPTPTPVPAPPLAPAR